jgi:hypothetical protein
MNYFIFALMCIVIPIDELSELKTELAATKESLAKANRKIEQLEKNLADAQEAGYYTDEKAISSALTMIKALPEQFDARTNQSWDQLELKEIHQFLNDKYVGTPFVSKATIKSLKLAINPEHVKNELEPKYVGTIVVRHPESSGSGVNVTYKFNGYYSSYPLDNGFNFYGSDEFKTAIGKLRVGRKLEIHGTIKDIELKRSGRNISATISLVNLKFEPAFPTD